MKAVREYIDGGGCGVMLREQYINGRIFDTASAAMRLGMYFEYILTGAKPKDGKVPEAVYMISKIKANKGTTVGLGVADMYEPYRMAHENRDKVLEQWGNMGLEIFDPLKSKGLTAGVRLTKGRYEGTIDVPLVAVRDIEFADGFKLKKGDVIIVDIKYSGLADDKWSVHGWQWTPDQKRYHGTQAKQYHFLTGLPMFFMIVDPGGKYVKWFRCVIDQAAIQRHIEEGNQLYKRLVDLHTDDVLEPRPEYNKCQACPLLSEGCSHAHWFPHPIEINLCDE